MTLQLKPAQIRVVKAALFVLCLVPALRLAWLYPRHGLGANPIEYITRSTGWWTLTFLALTLAVTPVRRWLNLLWLTRLRRMLGLFAFFYISLHFTTYIWLDQFFDWGGIVKDVYKRPFITVGFAAFVLLLPLAVTSTNAMVKQLGAKRWQRIHKLVYVIGVCGVVHYWWLVKKDFREPLVFATLIGALLIARVWFATRKAAMSRAPLGAEGVQM